MPVYVNNPPGNSSWYRLHQTAAITFAAIDPNKLGGWDTDFAVTATSASVTAAPSGSGAVNALGALGGRYQLTTGATGASQARLINGNLTVQPNTDKFYVTARVRVITTSDANSDNRIVSVNNTLASEFLGLQLKNNVLNLVLMKSGTPTTVATTWTPETTSYHDFAVSSDLTTVRAFVDGLQVGSTTTLTNLTNVACNWESNTQNGATAADQQIIVDKVALYTQAP